VTNCELLPITTQPWLWTVCFASAITELFCCCCCCDDCQQSRPRVVHTWSVNAEMFSVAAESSWLSCLL